MSFMKKINNKAKIITMLCLTLSVFTLTIIANTRITQEKETNVATLSNKKIGWGIKRNDNHNQPSLGEENKKLIFNRFNQVVENNSEVKGGSGLGLTISKQLISLHGGDIYVESEVGVGSEFIIILPVEND